MRVIVQHALNPEQLYFCSCRLFNSVPCSPPTSLTDLTDCEVQTLQAGQTFVAKFGAGDHNFRLWITGRNVGWPLHWPTFLPEEPFFLVRWLKSCAARATRVRCSSVNGTVGSSLCIWVSARSASIRPGERLLLNYCIFRPGRDSGDSRRMPIPFGAGVEWKANRPRDAPPPAAAAGD
jgi:hypothetical protein